MAAAPLIFTAVSTVLSMKGQMEAGEAEEDRARAEARQLKRKAKLEKAVSQRRAGEAERQGKLEQSRALAVAASSGAGASDPGIINYMAQQAAETNYRKMVALYEGEETDVQLRAQARATREGGRQAARAATIGAAGTALSGGASLYSKYG